ncbi:cupredoxin domain-containing protein [Candidatus Acetothermia bacterium]|nr:cupredoxin domain-containing protein [Candidatus Acetothermia bacterium]MBI3459542.1 cupredoxin domain-containing protein [Candidatus Acetothermia bacterium]
MPRIQKVLILASIALAFLFGLAIRPQQPTIAQQPPLQLPELRAYTLTVDGQFMWLPSSLTFTAGEKVKLHIFNPDKLTPEGHGFAAPGLLLRPIFLAPGADQEIEFTADKPGIYRYFCHIHGDIHLGGQIVVIKP